MGMGREKMKENFFKEPSPLPSPAKWRGLMKRKEFNSTPHFYSLPQGERRIRSRKIFRENFLPIDGGGLRWG
jgi:hypothetical protein